jgi:pimeloyl-ACP methyl ester carboxylesterase
MPYQNGLYYYAYHPQDEDRTPLVLLHGAGGDYLHWPFQIRRLSGFRVYALDLPGHGKSEGHGLQSIADYAGVIVQWMNEMEIPKAILIGHSMGSAIALWLAIHHPQRVWGLGLIGSGPTLPVNPTLLEETGYTSTFPTSVDKIIKWSFSPHTDRKLVETAKERMLQTRPSVLQGDFLACDKFDVEDQIQQISAATKIFCGGDDKMVPYRLSKQLAEGIPGADLEVIPEAGHMLMIEKPEALVSKLRPFLEERAQEW